MEPTRRPVLPDNVWTVLLDVKHAKAGATAMTAILASTSTLLITYAPPNVPKDTIHRQIPMFACLVQMGARNVWFWIIVREYFRHFVVVLFGNRQLKFVKNYTFFVKIIRV